MAQVSIPSDLFSDTSSFIEITDDVTTNTKTYTLTQDLIINQSNLTPAIIPEDNGKHIIFDGNGYTLSYVDANDETTTELYYSIFATNTNVNYNITIKNLGIIGGKTSVDVGFICVRILETHQCTILIGNVIVRESLIMIVQVELLKTLVLNRKNIIN